MEHTQIETARMTVLRKLTGHTADIKLGARRVAQLGERIAEATQAGHQLSTLPAELVRASADLEKLVLLRDQLVEQARLLGLGAGAIQVACQ